MFCIIVSIFLTASINIYIFILYFPISLPSVSNVDYSCSIQNTVKKNHPTALNEPLDDIFYSFVHTYFSSVVRKSELMKHPSDLIFPEYP